MNFGERLKLARKSRNLTQEQIGASLFIGANTVSKWESGGGVPRTKLKALAELLGVPITYFTARNLSRSDLLNILAESVEGDSNSGILTNEDPAGERGKFKGTSIEYVRMDRRAPVISVADFIDLARGRKTMDDIAKEGGIEGYLPHNLDGFVVGVQYAGPDFGRLREGYWLLLRPNPSQVQTGGIYVREAEGPALTVLRAEREGGRMNIDFSEALGSVEVVQFDASRITDS